MNRKLIIDGHAHACGEYLTTEKIKKKLTDAKVDMCLLTPGQYGSRITYPLRNLAKKDPLGDVVSKNNRTTSRMISLIGAVKEIPKGNEYVYQLKCTLPDQVKQCYWVTGANWKSVQQDYERMQFDTIKFHQCWEKFDLTDDFFQKTVEWAADREIPVFVHIRDLEQISKMVQFIKGHPKAIMIIGHLYGAELFMKEEKEYFRNTYFDLSNFYFVSRERTKAVYEYFGAEHLLMGSDTPYGKQSLENTIRQIHELNIPETDREKILGGNMAKLLKLI
ncbi:MAG: amidohydrolase family protein [Clostridiales bacterium]|nr:amidohydrolase family protein [Clostridiales bacterium]